MLRGIEKRKMGPTPAIAHTLGRAVSYLTAERRILGQLLPCKTVKMTRSKLPDEFGRSSLCKISVTLALTAAEKQREAALSKLRVKRFVMRPMFYRTVRDLRPSHRSFQLLEYRQCFSCSAQ
jgi:hypothetical protein